VPGATALFEFLIEDMEKPALESDDSTQFGKWSPSVSVVVGFSASVTNQLPGLRVTL